MSELAPTPTPVASVTCPKCATVLPCHDPAHSRYFCCFNCRTFFSANPTAPANVPQRLDGFKKALVPGPSLPLGMVAELGGHRCRLTGYQVRGEKDDRLAVWREYQLRPAEPLAGDEPADFPLQLAEYQGHWLLICKAWQSPDRQGPRAVQDGSWEDETGRNYRIWHRYRPLIRDAVGEFDWNVLEDERLRITEYTSPPYMLASEQVGNDKPTWYLAQHLEPEQVAQAFAMPVSDLPERQDVGAAQPNPTEHWPQLAHLTILIAVLLLVAQMVIVMLKPEAETLQNFTVGEPTAGATSEVLVSNSFEMVDHGAIDLRLEVPNLTNHWVEVTASLVNEQTGRGYEVTRAIEYYEGVEGGEHWTEGSRSTEAVLSSIPPGRYHVNLYPTVDKGTGFVTLQLTLHENAALWSNFFLILNGLALLPLWVWWRRRSFEQTRWANSDFNPYATTE